MKVTLLHASPKHLAVTAIRMCWATQERSDTDYENDVLGENDKNRIRDVIRKGHESTLEHVSFTFKVEGISRALLQELSRHRIGVSPSVESTRYTIKKVLAGTESVENCLVKTGNEYIDKLNFEHMVKLKALLNTFEIPNDHAKYGLVEAYKVNEQVTMNARSLRHFLQLRTPEQALWEIRQLAFSAYDVVPEDYDIFFEDIIEKTMR